MASNLLSIAETSQEIQIDEEKLRHICSRVNVWDHYGISRSQYVSLSDDEKLKMLKGFYKNLMPVYLVMESVALSVKLTLWSPRVFLTMKKFFLMKVMT